MAPNTSSNFDSRSTTPNEIVGLLDENEKTFAELEVEASTFKSSDVLHRILSMPLFPSLANLQLSQIRTLLSRIAYGFIPSFCHGRVSERYNLSPTAYLDGMRGLAALFVFFCHLSYTCFVITVGYGYGNEGQNRNILQLPFIRLIYSGPPMVCVFFVISGYALSLKPLKQMRAQAWDDLFNTMSSSIFRRGLRLFIPTTVSTFMVFLFLRMGLYEPSRDIAMDPFLHRNVQENHPLRLEIGFFGQFADWVYQMFNFVAVFSWAPFAGSTGYDVHLWTIPVEFRASLMLFLGLIGLARLKTAWRMTFLFGIWYFVFGNDRWELVLFFSGMAIAELDLIFGYTSFSHKTWLTPKWNAALWIILAVLSLYFMSQPDEGSEYTPGWIFLHSLIPSWFTEKYRFYQTLGSITLVLSVSRFPILQKPFTHPVIQYLGKISYALYLMHGPVMHIAGYMVEAFVWHYVTGYDLEGQYIAGFIISSLVNIPLVIWAADVFWRAVDAPSVKFARWMENKLLDSEKDQLGTKPGISRVRVLPH